jgi:non-lysosomal glucosylceramidase
MRAKETSMPTDLTLMSRNRAPVWPVLRRYSGEALRRIAMPIGGIGTGSVALGGHGGLLSWEIMNRPARGFRPDYAFFAIRIEDGAGHVAARAVEGQLNPVTFEGAFGSPVPLAGLPRFRDCTFEAAYPLGQVVLTDPDLPVEVRLQGFSPFIPTDADASGYPAAIMRYQVTNLGAEPLEISMCGSLDNITGAGGATRLGLTGSALDTFANNELRDDKRLAGMLLSSPGFDSGSPAYGSVALSILDPREPSHRTSWPVLPWGNTLLDFWDDFVEDGRVEDQPGDQFAPVCSVCDSRQLEGHGTEQFTFILAWHFPNRSAWVGDLTEWLDRGRLAEGDIVGNYYTTQFESAWHVTTELAEHLPDLEQRTVAFVDAFCGSDLPAVVKEAALFNLSTLSTQTCFRTADGRFFGWEGIGDTAGSCFGSCTHVWNYEQATAFLFGSLARSMREVEFNHATGTDGLMSFRVGLPLHTRARDWTVAAADGQTGALVKLYRDWRLSGDDNFLRSLWPAARRALEFCWLPGGWDADRDGVMEGAQHNTMDVEYYGPNPQMGGWYLAALRATEEMARHLGEEDLARLCRELYASGRSWIDAHLFNGRYYRHEIRPPHTAEAILAGTRHPSCGTANPTNPDLQLGDGCLVDQLVGQMLAHVCGIGHILDADNVRTTLQSVVELNFRDKLYGEFNHMRTFAKGDEAGLLMASYPPNVQRPKRPFPYFNEVGQTGFEYTAAAGLAYEGCYDDSLKVIQAIRDRFDGVRRNPFDEAECGRHYARAMASWAAVLAWTGFDYDARSGRMSFRAAEGGTRFAWSTGNAWGTWHQEGERATLTVHEGQLMLREVSLSTGEAMRLPEAVVAKAGDALALTMET